MPNLDLPFTEQLVESLTNLFLIPVGVRAVDVLVAVQQGRLDRFAHFTGLKTIELFEKSTNIIFFFLNFHTLDCQVPSPTAGIS